MALSMSEYVDQKKAIGALAPLMEKLSLASQIETEKLNWESIAKF